MRVNGADGNARASESGDLGAALLPSVVSILSASALIRRAALQQKYIDYTTDVVN